MRSNPFAFAGFVAAAIAPLAVANAETPAPFAESLVAVIHAEGSQIYECKPDSSGKFVWQFREPVATLFDRGKTVGRHYAGPTWDFADGSVLTGKVVGRAPGATSGDIPLLELAVASRSGAHAVAGSASIRRINTRGGVAAGPCETRGIFLSVPYRADYEFHRTGPYDQLGSAPLSMPGPYEYLFGNEAPISGVVPALAGGVRLSLVREDRR